MQMGLIFNGLLKVPMQFFILLCGIMVFVFYQFNPSPLNFIDASTQTVLVSEYGDDYRLLQEKQNILFNKKKGLSLSLAKNDSPELKQQISVLDSIEKTYRLKSKFLIKKAVDNEYTSEYNTLESEVAALKSNPNSEAYILKLQELKLLDLFLISFLLA